MTSLTLPTLAVVLFGALSNRHPYAFALSIGGVTAAGAAAYVNGIALPTFYAVAVGAAIVLAVRLLAPGGAGARIPPGVSFLLVFFAWSVTVTCVAPLLFPGLQTITPAHAVLRPGMLTSSNIAQMLYLALGICVVVLIANEPRAGVQLLGITVGCGVLLSLWRFGSQEIGLPFPQGLFDNSPTMEYIETAAGGIARFRGIFSEPSALAGTCLVMIAYGFSRAFQVRGLRRAGAIALIGVAIYLGIVSTSTTFIVAGVALVAVAGLTFLFGFLSRVTKVGPALGVLACALIVIGVLLLPAIADFVQAAVQTKVTGASYEERSGADRDSYSIFLNTWGLGVGVGSGRASSLVPTVLSTTGLFGGLLLAATFAGLLMRASSIQRVRPALWVLVAAVIAKIIAGPDLSDPSGIVWMALGLLSGAVMRDLLPPSLLPDRLGPSTALAISGSRRKG